MTDGLFFSNREDFKTSISNKHNGMIFNQKHGEVIRNTERIKNLIQRIEDFFKILVDDGA